MSRRGLAFGCLLTGSVLALISSAQPWWRVVVEGVVVKITGTQATGGLSQALAMVVLAGTLLMLALRARGCRIVAALLLLVGLGIVLVGGLRQQPSPDIVRSQVREVSLIDVFRLIATLWPWVFALSGVVIAAGAAVTMITASSWPSRSGRFQPSLGQAEHATSDDPAELWKAMDAGVDPTTDAMVENRAESPRDAGAAGTTNDHDTPTVADPEVRDQRAGDTMDGTEQAQQLPWSPTSKMPGKVQRGRGEREA